MPTYTFRMPARFASTPVTVYNTADVQQTTGTTDSNALFVASLPTGDYYAKISYGYTSYRAAGEVDRGDLDNISESALTAGSSHASLSTIGLRSQMSTARAALAAARTGGTCRIAFAGDSLTFGFGANTNRETENLARVFRDCLNAYTGLTAYEGMCAANSDTATGSTKRSYWTAGTGWAIAAGYGVGGHGAMSATSTATGTLDFGPFTCDGFTVKWMRRASTATFDIWVDAGAHTATGSAGADAIQTTTISAGSMGSHTLHVGSVGAGSQGAIILGVEPTVSAGGVKVSNFGVPGTTATSYSNSASVWATLPVVFDDWQPHLSIIGLGTNDYTTASNRTPAQYQADMTTIINKAKTYGSVLVWIEPERTDTATGLNAAPWAQYVAAAKASAAAAGVPVLDVGRFWGGTVEANGGLYNPGDKVHVNTEGHASIGTALFRAIYGA